MTKLNFNEVRGFSDSITFTFQFIKQEFKPLLKTFLFIALPVIFVDLFLKSYMMRDMQYWNMPLEAEMSPNLSETLTQALGNLVSTLISFIWVFLFVLSYLRVYVDKQDKQDESPVNGREIWKIMFPKIGVMLMWLVLYSLIVGAGTLFLFIPGIFFGVALLPSVYFIVLRQERLSVAMSEAMKIIKGQWWNFFAYLIVLQLIVGALSYVFSIPYTVITFTSIFTDQVPGVYEMTLWLLFSTLGQYLMQIILFIGIGVRFYSMLEEKEHTSLLKKIDQIGATETREEAF